MLQILVQLGVLHISLFIFILAFLSTVSSTIDQRTTWILDSTDPLV